MSSKEERETFSIEIERRAKSQCISHLEAILDYCESIGLEEEVAATLLNSSLKQKLELEADKLKFLKTKKVKKTKKKPK